MSSEKNNLNDTDKTGNVISWAIVIILLFVLPPAGWILLLFKLGVFANRKVNKGKRSRLDKKTGKGLSAFLLLLSIALFIAGASMCLSALSYLPYSGLLGLWELALGTLYLLGGSISFFSRNVVSRRFSRYKSYYAFIEGRGIVPIYELVQMAGVSNRVVVRDLQAMINYGYLDSGVYIDNELECLVLSSEEARRLRMDIRDSQSPMPQPEPAAPDQYAAILAELSEVNSLIKDEAISNKVDRLEELTSKIFRIVEDAPEKQSQLRRFMNYYLPTTLKMVRSYATLEKQGVKGDNIMSTKKRIGSTLDTLTTGFEQQLDQLFKADAIDIAADINVLENLMQQDGLTGGKPEFQVSEG